MQTRFSQFFFIGNPDQCGRNQFTCKGGRECIENDKVLDGVPDCIHGEDEGMKSFYMYFLVLRYPFFKIMPSLTNVPLDGTIATKSMAIARTLLMVHTVVGVEMVTKVMASSAPNAKEPVHLWSVQFTVHWSMLKS